MRKPVYKYKILKGYMVIYRVAPKLAQFFCTPKLYQLLTDFQNYFTARIKRKFAIKMPPHINCVATLPREMSSVLKATIENKTTSVTTH